MVEEIRGWLHFSFTRVLSRSSHHNMVTRAGKPDLSEIDVAPKNVMIRKKPGATLFDNDRTRAQTLREGPFIYGVLLFV